MARKNVEEIENIKHIQRINTLLHIFNDLCFFNLFYKAVKIMVCMVETVTDHALSTVRTTYVTYNLDTVLHVHLDGQENCVIQVWSIINLCVKVIRNINAKYFLKSCSNNLKMLSNQYRFTVKVQVYNMYKIMIFYWIKEQCLKLHQFHYNSEKGLVTPQQPERIMYVEYKWIPI